MLKNHVVRKWWSNRCRMIGGRSINRGRIKRVRGGAAEKYSISKRIKFPYGGIATIKNHVVQAVELQWHELAPRLKINQFASLNSGVNTTLNSRVNLRVNLRGLILHSVSHGLGGEVY